MNQLKYAWNDFKNNKKMMVLFICVVIVMFLFFTGSIQNVLEYKNDIDKLSILDKKGVYYAVDDTDMEDVDRIIEDEETVEKEISFFNSLEERNIPYYTEFEYAIGDVDGVTDVKEAYANKLFFEFYGFDVYRGRGFEKGDFSIVDGQKPIVVGYELGKVFKLNEVYEFETSEGEVFEGKIIGVLKKNSFFCRANDISVVNNVDKTYFIPINENYKDNKFGISDIDMSLTHMVVFTDDIRTLQNDHDIINSFNIKFYNARDRIEELNKTQRNKLLIIIGVIVIVISLMLVCLWFTFNKIIEEHMKEYGIHLMYGASYKNILIRFVWLVVGVELTSLVITFIVYKNMIILGYTVLLAIVLGILVLIYPYNRLKRLSIINILRNN